MNLIKINVINKKNIIQTRVGGKEFVLLKILIKINLITFVKKIKKNIFMIKPNSNFKLNIKNLLKKKKIIVSKHEKKMKNKIAIISNNKGICV
jgi:energy-converting hydrogenase Eha subunit H